MVITRKLGLLRRARKPATVREVRKALLGKVGCAALALIRKFPAKEVSANLYRLKEVMETRAIP